MMGGVALTVRCTAGTRHSGDAACCRHSLRREIAERSVPFQTTWWGYHVIRIDDPDGNELLFPLSNE